MTKEEAIKILEPKTGWAALMSYDYNLERQSHVINEACAIAVAALRAQEATPPNGPLTLEELRQMGGEPYWHVGLQEDSQPPHWNILDPFFAKRIEDYGYGKRWLAYRRRPEEG